jgi:hypothetical protein
MSAKWPNMSVMDPGVGHLGVRSAAAVPGESGQGSEPACGKQKPGSVRGDVQPLDLSSSWLMLPPMTEASTVPTAPPPNPTPAQMAVFFYCADIPAQPSVWSRRPGIGMIVTRGCRISCSCPTSRRILPLPPP